MASRFARGLTRGAHAGRLLFARGSADNALAKESDFLRWTTPVPQAVQHAGILAQAPTKVTTLANGLRVATESVPFAETATVGVWIDAGSRYETAKTNGTAHFLEHIAFKGTKKRSVSQLEQEVENMGAHLNAYTSREQTTYYAKVFKKDVGAAVEILADILQNSAIDGAAVERERSVILREMEEVEKESEEVLFDHLHATAFQFTPLGRTILGPADNVRTITKGDLEKYISTHYSAPRMVLVAAGAVDHQAVVKLAEAAFGNLPASTGTPDAASLIAAEPAIFTGSSVVMRDDDMAAAHVAVCVQGAAWNDADSVPLMVMQAMLGSWDKSSAAGVNGASPLAHDLAANDLADSYMAFNTNYHDTGLFGVHFVSSKADHLDDVAYVVMRELSRLAVDVSDEEVLRGREQLKASLTLHLEGGTSAIAEDIGRQLLTYGRRIPRAELFARIDAVTPAVVNAVASRFIRDRDVVVAAMGPTQFLPDLEWFRRRTFMMRY